MDIRSSDWTGQPADGGRSPGDSADRPETGSDSRFDIAAMLRVLREDFQRGFYSADEAESDQAPAGPRIELLTVDLGGQNFAIETRHIREIVKAPRIVPIPGTPAFILGIINLRGEIVSVIDLRRFLGTGNPEEAGSEWVVLVRNDSVLTGIRVDSVGRILQLPQSELKPPPPALAGVRLELIEGQFKLDGSLLILLSIPSIMACRELKAF